MQKYILWLIDYIRKLESKIAFYPTVFSFTGIIFALIMYYAENNGISGYIIKYFPALVINHTDTALNILTTFIAGLISIMVFSFSMVMILLSQASSNFSPRLLPGLISNRRHQKILGIYIASLLYCIFTLISIEPTGDSYQLPGFSVLFAIIFMVTCLGAFIYFIHSISQEIQVHNIMERIYADAKHRLEKLLDSEKESIEEMSFPDTDNWEVITAKRSGFLQTINLDIISKIAQECDNKFEVFAIKGNFIHLNQLLYKVEKSLDEEQQELIEDAFLFSRDEIISDNYILAFKQLTEVAVKAMSPGINDPGTAIITLDYLTELFTLRSSKSDESFVTVDDEALIKINTVSFENLMFYCNSALRTYVKHDLVMVLKMLDMYNHLYKNTTNKTYQKVIVSQVKILLKDAKASINNEDDIEVIEARAKATLDN
ncbi:DUF2254 domain-containing protein [Olleya sp. YS]|uniref:DUF2254 domain-containing protein n=1 Tax=Olleya sp. YS TaxID=3028318 RepID=UPI0024340F0B|nr:DUF2254 domain-containing protein [Olleya sp. YS]WGD33598.1 DUF2254 domain-containing protein [Olleya sp. YS]